MFRDRDLVFGFIRPYLPPDLAPAQKLLVLLPQACRGAESESAITQKLLDAAVKGGESL